MSNLEQDKKRAKEAVDDFLEKNGMDKRFQLDYVVLVEYLFDEGKLELNGDNFLDNKFAEIIRYDGKLYFNIQLTGNGSISNKMMVAIAYGLAIDYYKSLERDDLFDRYENSYELNFVNRIEEINTKLKNPLSKTEINKIKEISQDNSRKIINSVIPSNKTDYEYELSKDFMTETDLKTRKYRLFAEDLLSRDYLLRFTKDKNPNEEADFDY